MPSKPVEIEQDARWDERFMKIAATVGQDWGVGDGAVLVNRDNQVMALGYYSLPKGIAESPERTGNAAYMSERGVSAIERALIWTTAFCRSMGADEPTLYYWPGPLTIDDARLVIEARIKVVVMPPCENQAGFNAMAPVRGMFREAGVKVRYQAI